MQLKPPIIILKLFQNFSDVEPQYSYQSYSDKKHVNKHNPATAHSHKTINLFGF